MIKAGITGGIGSGKTTVCRIFQVMGVPCYLADDRAKALMNENAEVQHQLKSEFGPDIFQNGELDRKNLAGIVFNDRQKLEKLNNIVHPAVEKDFNLWVHNHSGYPLVMKEAALLFESGSYKKLDFIITVTAPEEMRIKRVMERDGVKRDDVLNRMKNQWPQEKKDQQSGYVIKNDGKQLIIPEASRIYEELKRKAENSPESKLNN